LLPQKHRIQNRQKIAEIKKKGKIFPSPLFGLLIFKKNHHQPSGFAFIVSTKIHKKSVKRNRIKRILSENVRLLLPQIEPGVDCLFLAKKTLLNTTFKDVRNEVKNTFQKAKILRKNNPRLNTQK
jgi:ribonuclease P protein component